MPYSSNEKPLFENGIPLEKYMARFFEHLRIPYDHNNFKSEIYPLDNHNIVDGIVRGKALIECTNPKETTFLNDSIMTKKLDYFQRKDPFHRLLWVLVVSFALFSDFIKQRIRELGIVLIELDYHADPTNRTAFIRHLFHTKLYSLTQKLKPRAKKFSGSSTLTLTSLDQYSVRTSNPAIATLNHLHQHQSTSTEAQREEPKTRFEPRKRFEPRARFT